ncbi:MAG: peptidase S8/S53 subtilisin kexin sedolisin [Chlorobi bacterium OLB5]|nr:MAG: peptidase S8/S53 subtilisin kexin sedolisin [Chlorobi bacterium OLB5]
MRKIFTILFLAIQITLFSQPFQANQWCSNFPVLPGTGTLWGHASVVLGDTIYVAGGSPSGGPSSNFYKYSISGNVWTTGVGTPVPKSGGDLVACRNKIYYIGGGNTTITTGTNETFVYNPATGNWSVIANIPTPVTGNVAEAYNDSLIYCMFGGWITYETLVQVYNVNTNTWAQATQITSGNGRRSFAGGILGNKLFVCAGYSGSFRNDFWVGTINPANPLQITWQQRTNVAIASSRPGGTAILGKFYVVMGEINGGSGNDSMAIWDTTLNSWSYKDGKPVRTNNLYGSVSASITYCNNRPGVKIWIAGGSLQGQTTRPLDVFADTCLLNCTGPLTGIQNNNIPAIYNLKQNYPNPFNPVTKISYDIPIGSNVKITISDLLGREVFVLINEYMPAGTHSVNFNADNLSSGVYFYKLESGEFIDSKKNAVN